MGGNDMLNIEEYKQIAIRCHELVQDMELAAGQDDDRSRLCLGLLQLVQEHHNAIILLIEKKCFGSAFALVRPLYEAFIRGVWILKIATTEDVEKFSRNGPINLASIAEKIAHLSPYNQSRTIGTINANINAMHSYTHGGMHSVSRRISVDMIEPIFGDDELIEVLDFAQLIGCFATCGVFEFFDTPNDRLDDLMHLIREATS